MRKIIAIFCLTGLLYSCSNTHHDTGKIEELDQRISELEQRLGSTGNNNNHDPDSTPISYAVARQMDRCLALTKKGTQCKRAGKNHGYCWQHEERR